MNIRLNRFFFATSLPALMMEKLTQILENPILSRISVLVAPMLDYDLTRGLDASV